MDILINTTFSFIHNVFSPAKHVMFIVHVLNIHSMWQKIKYIDIFLIANTKFHFFFFILMAIHDEGRFTMIQTKNTNSLKKKCVQKWQKPESQDFYKSILLSTVKVKFNHSIKRKWNLLKNIGSWSVIW